MTYQQQVTAVFINLKSKSEEELKQKLNDAVYQYRLFTEIQLNALFNQAINQN